MNTLLKEITGKILFVAVVMLVAIHSYAQKGTETEVPKNIAEAFEVLYPKIKAVSWTVDESHYEANFKLDGRAVSLVFDDSGSVSQVKNEIKQFELPMYVGQLLTKEYAGWRLGKASHIDSFGTAYYETVVEREEETVILVFNRDGGLMIKLIQ